MNAGRKINGTCAEFQNTKSELAGAKKGPTLFSSRITILFYIPKHRNPSSVT